jgi:hypothetical protein
MLAGTVPARHWRSYGDHPLPTGVAAMDEPLRAFPSWFLRLVCDRCGMERMANEAHMAQGEMLIRDIIDRMRHDGCGGRPEKAELPHWHRGRQQPAGQAHSAASACVGLERLGRLLQCFNGGRAGQVGHRNALTRLTAGAAQAGREGNPREI